MSLWWARAANQDTRTTYGRHTDDGERTMRDTDGEQPAPRTLLEQLIWERGQTFEEFAEVAEKFARDHDEPGTLSVRHRGRLVAGVQSDGWPLGSVRPAACRLLESRVGLTADELLAPL